MKYIRYNYNIPVNKGTKKDPKWEDRLYAKALPYGETGIEIAKREAYEGTYNIEDDGRPEPGAEYSDKERIAELEAALELLLSGVTE